MIHRICTNSYWGPHGSGGILWTEWSKGSDINRRRVRPMAPWPYFVWHAVMTRDLFLFFFCLFNSLYYYCSHMTDNFTFDICFCLPMTRSDSVLTRYCDSVLVLQIRDSLWLPYYTLTQDESFTVHWLTMSRSFIVYNFYCLQWLIVFNYYKYRRLWALSPQTWLLVSYGTTVQSNIPHLSSSHLVSIRSKYSL